MKILELLKAKKKEQNENSVKTPTEDKLKNEPKIKKQEEEEDDDDEKIIIDNQNKKEIGSPCIYNQRKTEGDGRKNVRNSSEGKFDINSLPKKIFRDEEDEEDNNIYDSHNRTLQRCKNGRRQQVPPDLLCKSHGALQVDRIHFKPFFLSPQSGGLILYTHFYSIKPEKGA